MSNKVGNLDEVIADLINGDRDVALQKFQENPGCGARSFQLVEDTIRQLGNMRCTKCTVQKMKDGSGYILTGGFKSIVCKDMDELVKAMKETIG